MEQHDSSYPEGVKIAGQVAFGVIMTAMVGPFTILATIAVVPISVPIAIRSVAKHGNFRDVPDYLHVTYPIMSACSRLKEDIDTLWVEVDDRHPSVKNNPVRKG